MNSDRGEKRNGNKMNDSRWGSYGDKCGAR